MKFLLQLSLLLFSWFNLSATPVFSKVASPNYAVAFHKTTNQNQESEIKIGVSNFARSGISENLFSQKAVLWESSVLENRAREGNDRVVTGVGKFSLQQIDDYVALATKQGNNSKVMLGKTDNGAATGYVSRASNDHSYFKMTDEQWDEALNAVGNNFDEMWKVNKKFIDDRKALGNEFYFSHNPTNADGFFLREVNYLTKPVNQGGLGGSIVNIGNDLWKLVW